MGRAGSAITVAGWAAVMATALAGCGFVAAGNASPMKPDGVVVRGHAVVPLSGSDPRVDGAACASPAAASDVVAGAAVVVADDSGKKIASGQLDPGVVGHDSAAPSCDFGFEIRGVPGDRVEISISVAGRPAVRFGMQSLRENQPAVIPLG